MDYNHAEKSLRWLANQFPKIEEPKDNSDKMVNCIHLYCENGAKWLRTIGLDLTYLEDYNLPNMQQLYQAAAETLEIALDSFQYSDGTSTATVLTYDRESRIDLDAMHYKFELRVVVEQPQTGTPMQTMDYNEEVTNG